MPPLARYNSSAAFVLLTIGGLFPGAAFFVVILLAIVLRVTEPARWLLEGLTSNDWSILIYLGVSVGSPVVSAISSLIAGIGQSPRRWHQACGFIAVGLLIVNGLLILFQVPLWLIAD